MKIVDTRVTSEVWITNDQDTEVQVKLRRFPLSLALYAPNDADGIVKLAWQRFNYCVTSWKGFLNENEKPLVCNEENKRIVFDFDEDTMLWIANEIHNLDKATKKKSKKPKT